jgi:hypothetical protein
MPFLNQNLRTNGEFSPNEIKRQLVLEFIPASQQPQRSGRTRAAGAEFKVICRRWLGTLDRFLLTD